MTDDDQLTDQLNHLEHGGCDCLWSDEIATTLRALRDERDALRAAVDDLALFADHETDCPCRSQVIEAKACTCGFLAVLAEHGDLLVRLAASTPDTEGSHTQERGNT